MSNSLFLKFLGKAPPLEVVRRLLLEMWRGMGPFTVSDMSNGFFLIHCDKPEMVESVLWEGPWTIGGMVLQLTPWKNHFQPAFEKLHLAAVWVQLHHLPIEYWAAEILELVGEQFGRLLKVDDHIEKKISRAKFARICVEIDLSKPLKRGFWIGDEEHRSMVAVVYEKLPVFCFKYGLIGHGEDVCSTDISRSPGGGHGNGILEDASLQDQLHMQVDVDVEEGEALRSLLAAEGKDCPKEAEMAKEDDGQYGPWMVVQRRRGRGNSQFTGSDRKGEEGAQGDATWKGHLSSERQMSSVGRHVSTSSGVRSNRGGSRSMRGGHASRHRDDALLGMDQMSEERAPESNLDLPVGVPTDPGNGRVPAGEAVRTLDQAEIRVESDYLEIQKRRDKGKNIMEEPLLSQPILISSFGLRLEGGDRYVSPGSHGLRRKDSCHNNLMDRILDALQKPESVGVVAGETDNSSDRVESDKDMTLVQYQKEAKAEAVAKRGAVRAASKAKKGRNSSY
ncbi:uncharacterized protein LOC120273259 [Dioscorea cayenensis subsp. rotundata]|uniref:Uncharacterized protein LOC120273259 n=1 Tax=Dioscorea cayennensis subsp. rotundata TaxID=55577 RepID=A0AB40CBL9_DIOCR|nr:uncharacterized protein LOC120273259 [Dioscorea cayenensis subsp. rotundata]